MKGLELRTSAISEVGLCKPQNEDRIMVLIGEGLHGEFGLFMVADGMGGQRGGAQAAEIAIKECEEWWNGILPQFISGDTAQLHRSVVGSLTEVVHQINEAVLELGRRIGAFSGTTLSLLFIYGTSYSYVHLGDSRIYKVDEKLDQMTQDDTWVAQQILKGTMTETEAKKHPNRHILTQCAGSSDIVHVHSGQGVFFSKAVFVLCSDGFYTHLTVEEIMFLALGRGCIDQRLRDSVKKIYTRGAKDNLSAIIVTILKQGGRYNAAGAL